MKQHPLVTQLQSFWQQREEREQRMLAAGGIVIALALIYSVLMAPALNGRQKLAKDIPVLRQQVAEVNALSAQQTRLNGSLGQMVEPVTHDIVEAGLTARGIKAQSISVTEDMVRLQISAVDYRNLMEWLVQSQKSSRLTVEEARLTALTEPGQVNAVLTLKQQRGGL